MLEAYFKAVDVLRRMRSGPTGPYMDGYAEKLRVAGYAYWTMRIHLRAAGRLGIWMEERGIGLESWDEAVLSDFCQHLRSIRRLRRNRGKYTNAVAGARLFLDYLREIGVVPEVQGPEEEPSLPALIEGFERWILRHRGVMPSTVADYRRVLVSFIETLGEDPRDYETKGLRQFVLERAARHSQSYAKTITTAVRMFLRYLVAHGLCNPCLIAAVPTIAQWRLSSLPRYLPWEDVERIEHACDLSTPTGMRDHAVLLLLTRLGLRAGDVVALRLHDVDWQGASIRVSGKSRREERLPLPQDVGDALLRYLEHGRPDVDSDRIFIRSIPPIQRPLESSAVSCIAEHAMRRAGVRAYSYGSHVLRHSAATQMLRDGASLEVVGSVLRHHSPDTTAHYAKVDFELLRQVVQPWPGEVSSC